MDVRNGSMTMMKRSGGMAGVLAMLAGGAVLTAGPAAAAEVPCQPATKPPSANTWYSSQGDYRGTRIVSRENYPNNRVAIQSSVVYETFGDGYYQKETWDLRRQWTDKRMDCVRKEDAKPKPQTPAGRGGTSSGGLGGLPVTWAVPSRGGNEEPLYGTVGKIQPL